LARSDINDPNNPTSNQVASLVNENDPADEASRLLEERIFAMDVLKSHFVLRGR
jgi:hypothetical protein